LNQSIPAVAWLLFCVAVIWALIYDTQYAMVDRDDDLKIGIKSSAILFGRHDRLVIGVLQLVMMSLLLLIGILIERSVIYYLSLAVAGGLFIYQQWLIRAREPRACFEAFLNNNIFGMVVFIGLVIDYLAFA
jgi:4-hydroxybenzoate polyprenyltransferase